MRFIAFKHTYKLSMGSPLMTCQVKYFKWLLKHPAVRPDHQVHFGSLKGTMEEPITTRSIQLRDSHMAAVLHFWG